MTNWDALNELATRQHGVLSRAQLLDLGMAAATVPRLVSQRGWTRVHPGVYRAPGTAASFPQAVTAAQLALPFDSVATGATAAHLLGIRPAPEIIDLLIDEEDRASAPAGVRLRRTRTLEENDSAPRNGIRTASPCRMVVDFAALHAMPDLRALIIDARQRRLIELPEIEARLVRLGPVRGRGALRRLVWELDEARCDSVLELRVRHLLADRGLPRPAAEPVPVRAGGRDLHVDIGWPDAQVGIEVDGRAYHSSREQLERDHRRGNALLLAGWRVLHVGWARVERDPGRFAGEVATLLMKVRANRAHMRA